MAKANPVRGKPLNGTKKHQTAKPAKQEIDWNDIEQRVRLLSRAGDDGVRLIASPEEILVEAHHLAGVYQKAGLPLPDTLAALV